MKFLYSETYYKYSAFIMLTILVFAWYFLRKQIKKQKTDWDIC